MNISYIKKSLVVLLLACIPFIMIQSQDGATLFKPCSACHSIGGGRMIGPDLKGITRLRTNDWLIKFIQSPVALLNSGDSQAKLSFTEFKNIPMPDNNLTVDQINKILEYIDGGSGGNKSIDPAKAKMQMRIDSILKANSSYDVEKGKALFNGSMRFETEGVSCASCHNISNNKNSTGGTLAKDLTKSFTRLNGFAGIKGIISSPPFPSMTEAYKNNPITDEEIAYLQLFLRSADARNPVEPVLHKTWFLHAALTLGMVFILSITLLWFRRKRKSVNDAIIIRQERVSK